MSAAYRQYGGVAAACRNRRGSARNEGFGIGGCHRGGYQCENISIGYAA